MIYHDEVPITGGILELLGSMLMPPELHAALSAREVSASPSGEAVNFADAFAFGAAASVASAHAQSFDIFALSSVEAAPRFAFDSANGESFLHAGNSGADRFAYVAESDPIQPDDGLAGG
jgi:hypothetical protein